MSNYKKPLSLLLASTMTVSLGAPLAAQAATPKVNPDFKPNIVYMMADDLTAQAISAIGAIQGGRYGGRYAGVSPTPNIDRIAQRGAILTNTYVNNAICVPSRAAIMTGKHSHAQGNGVYGLEDILNPENPVVSTQLKDAGYNTALIGKWHVHSEPQGFDHYNILIGQGSYPNPPYINSDLDPVWPEYQDKAYRNANLQPYPTSGMENAGKNDKYATWCKNNGGFDKVRPINNVMINGQSKTYSDDSVDLGNRMESYATMDRGIYWIGNRTAAEKKNPFMIMVQDKAPHVPDDGYDTLYPNWLKDIQLPSIESFMESDDRASRDIASKYLGLAKNDGAGIKDTYTQAEINKANTFYQNQVKGYLRLIHGVDLNVGRMMDYLEATDDPRAPGKKMIDTTVVMFTSDQGLFVGEHTQSDKRWALADAMRMPMLVSYPEEIPAGSVCDDMISNIDFAPTMLDYAGVTKGTGMQGRSFRENVAGNTPRDWDQSVYFRYWSNGEAQAPAQYAVRTKDYLYVQYYGMNLDRRVGPELLNQVTNKWTPVGAELYDTTQDYGEENNLYYVPNYAGVKEQMESILERNRIKFNDTDERYPELQKRVADFKAGKADTVPDDKYLALTNQELYLANAVPSKAHNDAQIAKVQQARTDLLTYSTTGTYSTKAPTYRGEMDLTLLTNIKKELLGIQQLSKDQFDVANYDCVNGITAIDFEGIKKLYTNMPE